MAPSGGQGHLFAVGLVAEAERVAKESEAEGSISTAPPKAPRKKGKPKDRFPEHLPRVKSRYELPKNKRKCRCGGELHEIGVERVKELERLETAILHEIERAKYGRRKCAEGVVTAPGPNRVIAKGLLGPSFLASVITERFGNHMPYHRLEKKYAHEGLKLSRSVLERSTATCADLLEPIWKELGRRVLEAPALHTDDTGVTIARGPGGMSQKGHAWIYLDLEDRHYYEFTETWKKEGPFSVLGEYKASFTQMPTRALMLSS